MARLAAEKPGARSACYRRTIFLTNRAKSVGGLWVKQMTSIELRQNRAKLIEDAGKILTDADKAGRKLTTEESERFDKLHADADELFEQVERQERQERLDREMAEQRARREPVERNTGEQDYAEFRGSALWDRTRRSRMSEEDRTRLEVLEERAFDAWLRGGPGNMTEGQRALGAFASASDLPPEARAQTVTTTGGGYLIPEGFQRSVDVAMLAYGGMRDPDIVTVLRTSKGNQIPMPTSNDTGNTGRLLTINTAVTTTDVAVGQKLLNAYKYSSDQLLVPSELLQDEDVDMVSMLNAMLAERLGRITNNHLTVGDGSSKPQGIVTAATDSSVDLDISDMASGASGTYLDIVDLEHSVDPSYRPGAAFMCHDDMLKNLKKVLDGNGRPIFRGGMDAPGQIGTLLGQYPVHINQDVPDPGTATNKALLFGALKKYITRVVRPMVMFRLLERYRDSDQDGFFAFERIDGELIDAGTNPVKYADCVA